MKFYVFLYIIVFISFSQLFAEEKGLIEVSSEVDTSVITIGDRINYSIIIDRASHLKIMRPGEGLNLGSFEIKDYNFPDPEVKDDRIIERFNFNLSVYDTGSYEIPPYPVAYFLDDTSSAYSVIEAPAIPIYVKSVLTGEDAAELKDVKAPLEIPFNYFFWISMAVVGILVLVSGWLVYYLIKKRREKGYLFTPPEPLPPAHEVALQKLEELFADGLIEQKRFKEFFSRLSEIMRVYLEGRYYFPALEDTTREIISELSRRLEDDALIQDLKSLLTLADLVKFAKYIPEAREIERSKNQALDFVNKTKIIFEPQTDDAEYAENQPERVAETTTAILPEEAKQEVND